jgi:hypothetical protein
VLLAARVFAPALIDAVTVAVAPAASVPPAADKVTHVCVFDAVQLIEAVPVFVSVYAWLDGVNGPPNVPVEVRPPKGDTDSGPAVTVWQFGSFESYRLSPSLSNPLKSPIDQFSLIFDWATGLQALLALVPVVP